uniref:Helicase n=1 Tax=viral metagenome TaxID=1070528 RepID=A0A6C0B6F0_9ZZZZ
MQSEILGEEEFNKWDDFEIKTDLLRGIYTYGFENPSAIQKKTFPHIKSGRDIIAQAQSGSGKTGAFTIGLLERIDINDKSIQGLIIVPTHELANQISTVITSIGSIMKGLVIKTMVGGTSIQESAAEIKSDCPHIVVGCAGRIFDMVKRRHIILSSVKLFILDEADEMLSRGFKDQIYNIFQYFDKNIQVALFSATIPPEILLLTDKFMRDPVKITVKAEDLTLECIEQFFLAIYDDFAKFDMLKKLFSIISISQCIIYCNSVKRVTDLYDAMTTDGFSVCQIHSSIDKSEREKTFKSFRGGNFRVLISSNVTARGIDIQQVSTVINFDIPKDTSTYLHRIGRSGRWGRKGCAINFVTKRDIFNMRKIEEHFKINIKELPIDYGK